MILCHLFTWANKCIQNKQDTYITMNLENENVLFCAEDVQYKILKDMSSFLSPQCKIWEVLWGAYNRQMEAGMSCQTYLHKLQADLKIIKIYLLQKISQIKKMFLFCCKSVADTTKTILNIDTCFNLKITNWGS